MKEIFFKPELFCWNLEENEIYVKMCAAKWQWKRTNRNNSDN